MMRLFYMLGVLSLLGACGILGLCAGTWGEVDQAHEAAFWYSSAVQSFVQSAGDKAGNTNETSPLMAQAEVLASCLNPPQLAGEQVPRTLSMPKIKEASVEPMPSIRPAAPSVRFKLRATSCYPNEPNRSMALISDVGSPEGDQRWVKEGAKLGHFVVHEIQRGMIVYRDGEQLREMAVERGTALPMLVRDPRPASPTARATLPAEPATIDIGGID